MYIIVIFVCGRYGPTEPYSDVHHGSKSPLAWRHESWGWPKGPGATSKNGPKSHKHGKKTHMEQDGPRSHPHTYTTQTLWPRVAVSAPFFVVSWFNNLARETATPCAVAFRPSTLCIATLHLLKPRSLLGKSVRESLRGTSSDQIERWRGKTSMPAARLKGCFSSTSFDLKVPRFLFSRHGARECTVILLVSAPGML